jgi:dinuclear metal center YbgI/SA1388 family protein
MTSVASVAAALAEFAPPALAADWDRVGLLAGDPVAPVTRVLVAHDLVEAVLDEAAACGAELIVCYHPPLFAPLAAVRADQVEERRVWRAVREGRSLYATHTALDHAPRGTNEFLAEALGLTVVGALRPLAAPAERVKLVTFVPRERTDAVAAALAAAGAGRIGDYAECGFRVAGEGTFRGLAGSRPAVGEAGRLERVAEDRLEMVVPRAGLAEVVSALRAAHPYEEVAFDVYALEAVASPVLGGGRLAELAEAETLEAFVARVEAALAPRHLRFVGDGALLVRRVALVAGSGASFLADAVAAGADVLVTGDVRHHEALRAARSGLALVDPGHFASERPVCFETAAWLRQRLPELTVSVSSVDGEPFARRAAR